jgi:DNA-binding MarR family transcriptional regulator
LTVMRYNFAVSQENIFDTQVDECLNTWEISLLDEWDLLVFLHRHGTSLLTVEHISRLLGYGTAVVAKALVKMERVGLVCRSAALKGHVFTR